VLSKKSGVPSPKVNITQVGKYFVPKFGTFFVDFVFVCVNAAELN
jgi:hypothetical protein